MLVTKIVFELFKCSKMPTPQVLIIFKVAIYIPTNSNFPPSHIPIIFLLANFFLCIIATVKPLVI